MHGQTVIFAEVGKVEGKNNTHMSDTYNYNAGGFPMGGCGFPFMGGCGYGGGYGMEWIVMLLFFGLFGWGGGGFGFGGGYGGGAGVLGATSLAATETAALINQQNTADRVAAANAKADAIAGIVTANGTKLETVKDAVVNGFYANQTNLCELGNNVAMQNVNNYNGLTNQITDLRFQLGQCCCQTQQKISDLDCKLSNQIQGAKAEIIGYMQSQRMAELDAKNLELKGQISQNNQTNQITQTIISALGNRGCNPCGANWSNCATACNPCYDGIQRAVNNALGERIGEILFPTTATTPAG